MLAAFGCADAYGRAEAHEAGEPVIGRRWAEVGRRRWGWVTGIALLSGFLGVPMVWGDAVLPVDVPLLDNVAWLPNDARGEVVRVNGESGEVDARLGVGENASAGVMVEQADGVAVVRLDGELRAIDVARLEWGAAVSAEGEVVVGDRAAYLVHGGGLVRPLDPGSLAPTGEVDLGVALGRGVVVQGHLAVPGSDGGLYVVDGSGEMTSDAVGDPGHDVRVSVVGDEIVAVDLTAGLVRRFELDGGALRSVGEATFDVPDGEVVVPPRLPEGRLWLLALRSGELHGLDVASGESASVQVTEPRRDVAGPVVAQGRVYVVDRATARIVEVDAETMEIVHEQALEVEDASRVDVVVQSDTVFVNDRASATAMVIDGDDHRSVDKYSGGGEPGDDGPIRPDPGDIPQAPDAPDPGPEADDPPPAGDPGDPDDGPPATAAPGGATTTTSTTTTTTTTTTTLPPTTTTTRPRTPPGAVTGLNGTPGDASVFLQWGAAASALPVTYTITVSPAAGGTTFTTTDTSYSFTGLTNDVRYRFTVTPTNADGAGPGAQTDATPTSPAVPPSITDVVAREEDFSNPNAFEVAFDYTVGTGTPISCTVEIVGQPGSSRSGNCDGSEATEIVGGFFLASGESASFLVTITTSEGTDTAQSDTVTAGSSGWPTAAGPPPPRTPTATTTTSPTPTGTPCTIDGRPATCYLGTEM
jgi:hypothetical protein